MIGLGLISSTNGGNDGEAETGVMGTAGRRSVKQGTSILFRDSTSTEASGFESSLPNCA